MKLQIPLPEVSTDSGYDQLLAKMNESLDPKP